MRIMPFLAVTMLFIGSALAQAPQKMSYQAVVRNSSNVLVTNTSVGMRIVILQGSVTGSAVYIETHIPSTNANGLVSIEIGGGTVVNGNFSTINWANGPYFIKTETDPTGGTNYSILGTSQLLSVPYALHAKTAESISGTGTETDPVFNASVSSGITSSDTTNWNNKLDVEVDGSVTNELQTLSMSKDTIYLTDGGFVKLPKMDGSETKVTAGTNVTVTGTGTAANPYVINAIAGGSSRAIGQSYQGGVIFWLDSSGQHGLIASPSDQSTGVQWYNGTNRHTGTTGDGLYAGAMNTTLAIATQMADNQTGTFAAKVCADYSVTVNGVTYGDWYLPSKEELNLLFAQKAAVGGFSNAYYWSSSEGNNIYAWSQSFQNGNPGYSSKSDMGRVRAVRAF